MFVTEWVYIINLLCVFLQEIDVLLHMVANYQECFVHKFNVVKNMQENEMVPIKQTYLQIQWWFENLENNVNFYYVGVTTLTLVDYNIATAGIQSWFVKLWK